MATISLFFIAFFILVQTVLGLLLVYRGIATVLERFDEIFIVWRMVAVEKLREVQFAAGSLSGWRRAGLVIAILLPGSLPLLAAVLIWRLARRTPL